MASSPVEFLFALLFFCAVGWVVLVFAARLLAWFLSRIMGASIEFQVAGCNCLRDVTVQFRKGTVESLSVGEIKLGLRKLIKLGFSFVSREPKLQLLLCDLEIVIRSSEKNIQKSKPQRSHSAGGRWMVLTNMGRFLSVTVTELVIKIPKAGIEVKDLTVDISKNGGSNPILNVKLHLKSFLAQVCDSQLNSDPSSSFSEGDFLLTRQSCSATIEKNCAPFICEDFLVSCEFDHNREQGLKIRDLDMRSGDITINLNENMFLKTKPKSESLIGADSSESSTEAKRSQKDSHPMKKHILMFPEKVSFNMPKLNVTFMHRGEDLFIQNNVMGIHLRSSKSQAYEDSGIITSHFDIQLDFSEIHLLREGATSILGILKVAVIASVDVPMQPSLPIRTEIDLKLGGTQCNLIMSRLRPWLRLQLSQKKKKVLREEKCNQKRSQASNTKAIMWTCTFSAPEMNIVLYSLNDLPLYNGCSQSSHLFANNIASKGIQVHAELGELHLHMAEANQDCSKENLFDVEINSGSLMQVARVSLDWGHREMESHEGHDPNRLKLVLAIDITGIGVFFGFQHVESLILTIMSFKALLQSLSGSGRRATQNKVGRSGKTTVKGTHILKLNLDKCSINYYGDMSVEDMVVADPKRVNFGSQGGEVLISVSADGTPRRASITSTISSDCKHLKFSTSLNIAQLSCLTEKHSMKIELQRAKSIYQEYFEDRPGEKVALFDMQKAKFVRRSGGHNDIVCSLFNVTDVAVRWEPDVHLALFDFITRLRSLPYKMKNQDSDTEMKDECLTEKDMVPEKEVILDQVDSEKQHRKRESVFAIDLETLKVSAELADGVEAMIHVQSIFSENAKIGVLLEGLILSFNEARFFKSTRMQISRIPISMSCNLLDGKVQPATAWDWVIQGPDVHICMPYRLQLRAIDDAVEDTLRGLKLITRAKTDLIYPVKKDTTKKPNTRSTKLGSVRFIIRKLTADIEEEPIQGWLDQHYKLMKNEVREEAVRLKFFDDVFSAGSRVFESAEPNDLCSERKIHHNGVDIDAHDATSIQSLREEIHKLAFRSYYEACQKMVFSDGSGACKRGFQAGFRPSTVRDSLLSLCATDLDVTLTKIEGSDAGMVEFIKKLDPICVDNEIPFSRMYGSDFVLNAGSLVIQLRDYTFPLFSATSGKCQGCIVLAQQATCFQPQIQQDVYIGRWWRVRMLRSASGTTPPMKMYSDMPICFQKVEVSFGVGYEPTFADISYAFTVALRRANLGNRSCTVNTKDVNAVDSVQTADANLSGSQPPKKERSLPWWDDMRYYIHGKVALCFTETKWNLLATTDPYEKLDKLEIISGYMEIQQTDGRVRLSTKDFKAFLSSMESLLKQSTSKLPFCVSGPFLESPAFSVEVLMDWECESGSPLNHYLHALPNEGEPRKKVYDPFRSTSLSLRWSFSLRPSLPTCEQHAPSASMGDNTALEGSIYYSSQKLENTSMHSPTVYLGAHDLVWLIKWWNMNYLPPYKLRSFSRWPRFGVPRAARSGNLSLDRVMTEFFLRLDCTPTCIQHMPLNDDPSRGLTFEVAKLKFELCYSRGKQQYTFDCKRYPLDLVYRGLDLHLLKAYLNTNNATSVVQDIQTTKKSSETVSTDKFGHEKCNYMSGCTDKHQDDGFLLHSDYFTIRKQTPKADPTRLLAWQEDGERHIEMKRSEFENGSDSDQTRSDPSDDDGFNVVIADNCQRVFVYGLKLLWTIENRDAVLFFVRGISNAFEPPKPSPSRQYAQRKLFDGQQTIDSSEMPDDDALKSSPSRLHGSSSTSPQHVGTLGSLSSHSPTKLDCSSSTAIVSHYEVGDSEEEGTRHFMVNFIQPQFNLHSEEANGRFLLAAASGRILARSFHSVLHVGYEMIEQALGTSCVPFPETQPEMAWNRVELSVMLEHVQAHVAPTDVDPGAGLQWLPKILRSSPKVKRTGALLERVFMPCQMYFRYTRHKGGTPELKVKPLKELSFNSPNITATMTSRQFQVMLDVLSNLLFARLPKPRKSILSYPSDDDDYIDEEADEVVPDGVEEVELAKIDLEERERERKLLLDDIKAISIINDVSGDSCLPQGSEDELWMISGEKSILVQGLKKELANIKNYRKAASSALRMALRKAAQLRLMEKEKNKSPSYAMRVSIRVNKVVWSMLEDGKSFVEAEINDMIYDFDRDYKDIGVAQFTIKSFDLRNCLPNAKSDMLLSAWNPPPEWGKTVMLRVNSKQGTPKDGNSPLDLFRVEIYPLKIHLTETMYRMMWDYFFPGEDQDSQRRQEVWKVSTTSGSRRVKKSISGPEATTSSSHPAQESDAAENLSATTAVSVTVGVSADGDSYQVPKFQNLKAGIGCGSTPELRRSSSFDRTWEENVAESVANELVLQVHSSSISSSKSGPLNSMSESKHATNEETSRNKPLDSKQARSGRLSQEEKKAGKSHDEKRGTRSRKMMEFHNIKISQVELLLTYEGSRFAVSDLRLLMDTFHRDDFTGTWTRLFSRVKKHIIWGVLKSVTGMQGKKFKAKSQSNQRETHAGGGVPERDLNFSDSDGDQSGKPDQFPISWPKRPSDGAGDGFVTSIRGLFNSQRRRAKAFVLRTMRGEADNEFEGEWSESDAEFTPFARQLTITKAKKLIRRHTNKFRQRTRKTSGEEVASQEQRSHQSSPKGTTPFQSDSSDEDASSSCEQLNE